MAGLRKTLDEPPAELRKIELARLDRLMIGLWKKAKKGDLATVNAALRVMVRRARLLGLDAPTKHEIHSCLRGGDWPSRWWQRVSESEQADYLVRAYEYALYNWPWMGVMSFFNMDFATVPWYHRCEPMRWYSITYRILDPYNDQILYRDAYYALQAMAKGLGPYRAYVPIVMRAD